MATWYTSNTSVSLPSKFSANPQHATSVASILDDLDFTKQLMSLGEQGTQFVNSHPNLVHQLLQLITVMPKPDDTDERKYKHPMLACDILTRNQGILGHISELENEQLLNASFELLFKLFDDKSTLNSILPGYFERVFQVLCKPRFYSKLLKFLYSKIGLVGKMIEFCESLSVSKCLLLLIAVDSKEDYEITEIGKWVQFKKDVLKMCIDSLPQTVEQVSNENIILEILKELVDKQEFIYHKRDLVPILFESSNMEVYLKIGVSKPELRYQTLLLLNTLLSNLIKSADQEIPPYFESCLSHLVSHLPKLLEAVKWKSCLETSEALETFSLLLKIRHLLPCKLIIKLPFNVFERTWNLVMSSPESNILQNKFERLLHIVVDHPSQQLIHHCFSNFNMIQKILDHCLEKPCSGFLIRIIESWIKPQNYPIMEPYLKINKAKMDEFTRGPKLLQYLKNCRLELGKMEVPEQKETPQYTVKKFIIEKKVEPMIMEDCLEFGPGFEISFELNDPPCTLAPDAEEVSLESLTAPLNFADGLSEVSLQKNHSTTSNDSVSDLSSSKITKQVSFQQFMKSKKESVTAEIHEKSKTPNKKSEREGSRSLSKKKVNKWGNKENDPSVLSLSRVSEVSVDKSEQGSQDSVLPVYLPKINIYQVPAHRIKSSKTVPNKQRKVSPTRDPKLFKIMKAMREQGQLLQV